MYVLYIGAFMINAITAAQNQSVGQYAAAGGLATEALNAIRTVSALNAQPDVISRYRKYLFTAMQVSYCLYGSSSSSSSGSSRSSCC